MSNLATGAPVDWLFWGQDRFGSWPFLLARAGGALMGRAWTPHAMHVLRTLWMIAALWPWLALAGRAGVVAAAGLLLLPGAEPASGERADGPRHRGRLAASGPALGLVGPAPGARGERAGGWLALAVVAAALASWTSLVSAPLLLMLGAPRGRRSPRSRRRRALLVVPALVARSSSGGCAPPGTRRSGLAAGVTSAPRHASTSGTWSRISDRSSRRRLAAWSAVPWLVAALACAAVALVAGRARPMGLRARHGRRGRGGLRDVLARRGGRAARAGQRVRPSLPRRGSVACGARRLRAARARWSGPRSSGVGPRQARAVLAALALAAWCSASSRRGRPRPARGRCSAPPRRRLAGASRARCYVVGYWRTYALAALLPPGAVIPVPREGEWNRRPDWAAALRSGRPVLVGRPDVGAGTAPGAWSSAARRWSWSSPMSSSSRPFPGESTGERLSLYRAARRRGPLTPRVATARLLEAPGPDATPRPLPRPPAAAGARPRPSPRRRTTS